MSRYIYSVLHKFFNIVFKHLQLSRYICMPPTCISIYRAIEKFLIENIQALAVGGYIGSACESRYCYVYKPMNFNLYNYFSGNPVNRNHDFQAVIGKFVYRARAFCTTRYTYNLIIRVLCRFLSAVYGFSHSPIYLISLKSC